MPYLSQNAVPAKYPDISMHSRKKLGGQNTTLKPLQCQEASYLIVIYCVCIINQIISNFADE